MKRLILIAIAAACLLVPASAMADPSGTPTARHHAHVSYASQLQAQNRQLRRIAAVRLNTIRALQLQNSQLRLSAYAATVTRDQALAGLPEAIKAVPIKDFHRLVFLPAFTVFPCDSYATSNTSWTFTFSSKC